MLPADQPKGESGAPPPSVLPSGDAERFDSLTDPFFETSDNNVGRATSVPESAHRQADFSLETGAFPVPQVLGRYEILQQLGRGGFGTVYVANDTLLQRKVALKVPHRARSQAEIERFLAEARRLARLQHPGIVTVHDVGSQAGLCYIVTDLLRGQSLAMLLRERRLAWQAGAQLLATVAEALAHAHARSMVHRDVKPANIFITESGLPVLIDFGLALTDTEEEALGKQPGSPAYMAPEQVLGRAHRVDGRTDVYSLGVVLYELLCGRIPFRAATIQELFRRIQDDLPQPPRQLAPQIPVALEQACLRALSKSMDDRFTTASDFADAISAAIQPGVTGSRAPRGRGAAPTAVRWRREAELRPVTLAIFSFEVTAQTAELSLEARQSLRQNFATLVADRVKGSGGTLVTSGGNQVLACFGFPVAFEDAAERAVRAAMEVLRSGNDWADDLRARTGTAIELWGGVLSGEAITQDTGDGPEDEITLTGDIRDIASRLEPLLQPGCITVTRPTHARVRHLFEFESAGTQQPRGVRQPIELFRVIRELPGGKWAETGTPVNTLPLTGRDSELAILKDRWEQACERTGQVVLLAGDPGLGKSRLIRELAELVRAQPGTTVIEAGCSAYHCNTELFPLIDHFTHALRFRHDEPAAARCERIADYLADLRLDSAENRQLLAALLGVRDAAAAPSNLSPQKSKERTEDLLLHWVRRLAERGPLLFIVEDLHWADPSTVEFLNHLAKECYADGVLCLLTMRTEFKVPWGGQSHQTQITLNRLTKRQTGEMLKRRLIGHHLPQAMVERFIERTDGVPLFIEEFIKLIEESGALQQALSSTVDLLSVVPPSLQEMLVARLDRRASDSAVVQLAATIGREFTYRLLAAASGMPEDQLGTELNKLVQSELLFQKGRGEEASYSFKHALLQDSAYNLLLTDRRRQFHLRIAEVLEQQFPEVVRMQPEMLARHLTEAGETIRGIQYWLEAGLYSLRRSANQEAIHHLQQGLTLLAQLPSDLARDQLELQLGLPLSSALMGLKGYAAPEVEPVQDRCIAICQQLGDQSLLFQVLMANWAWMFIRGRTVSCLERCRVLLDHAHHAGDAGMLTEAHWAQTCTSFYHGDFPATRAHAEAGFATWDRTLSADYVPLTQQDSGPLLLVHEGMTLWVLGFPDQAFARVDAALRLADELDHPFTRAVIQWKAGQTYEFARLGQSTWEYGRKAHEIATEQGFAFWIALGVGCQGVGLKLLGRYDEAVEAIRESIVLCQATGAKITLTKYKGQLADALWQQGQRQQARTELQEAFALLAGGEGYFAAELHRLLGDFNADEGDTDAAEAAYRMALQVARQQHALSYELRASMRLAQLFVTQGRRDQARDCLRPVYQRFTEGFETPDLLDAKRLLDELA